METPGCLGENLSPSEVCGGLSAVVLRQLFSIHLLMDGECSLAQPVRAACWSPPPALCVDTTQPRTASQCKSWCPGGITTGHPPITGLPLLLLAGVVITMNLSSKFLSVCGPSGEGGAGKEDGQTLVECWSETSLLFSSLKGKRMHRKEGV